MGSAGPVADWRDADAYAPLLAADRSLFAWEWLRREPAYRAAARAALKGHESPEGAERWGLHRFEDPDRAAPEARPVWRADRYRHVLSARAAPPVAPGDALDLARLSCRATLVRGAAGAEHMLFSDGLRTVRLDLVGGGASAGRSSCITCSTAWRRSVGLCWLCGDWPFFSKPGASPEPSIRRSRARGAGCSRFAPGTHWPRVRSSGRSPRGCLAARPSKQDGGWRRRVFAPRSSASSGRRGAWRKAAIGPS